MKHRHFLCMLMAVALVFTCVQPAFAEGMLGDPRPGEETTEKTLSVCGLELEDGECLYVDEQNKPQLATCSIDKVPKSDYGYAQFIYDEDNDVCNLILDDLRLDEGLTSDLSIYYLVDASNEELIICLKGGSEISFSEDIASAIVSENLEIRATEGGESLTICMEGIGNGINCNNFIFGNECNLDITTCGGQGIVCNDFLIHEGTHDNTSLVINSSEDGIICNAFTFVASGSCNIYIVSGTTGDDSTGINASGDVLINTDKSSDLTIQASGFGIDSSKGIKVLGGSVSITGSENVGISAGGAIVIGTDPETDRNDGIEIAITCEGDGDNKGDGIKADSVTINSGQIDISGADHDGIEAKRVVINGGDVIIQVADKAIDSDEIVIVDDVNIWASDEIAIEAEDLPRVYKYNGERNAHFKKQPKPQYPYYRSGGNATTTPAITVMGSMNNPIEGGKWEKDEKGNWRFSFGKPLKNAWGCIKYGEKGLVGWFWFDENEIMKVGWQMIGGKWYYLNPVEGDTYGVCQLGGVTPDGYKLNNDGSLCEE